MRYLPRISSVASDWLAARRCDTSTKIQNVVVIRSGLIERLELKFLLASHESSMISPAGVGSVGTYPSGKCNKKDML